MIPMDSRSFAIPNHSSHAMEVMNDLRLRNELCDIVISIGNKEFEAHRVVLAGSSPYLRAMFTNGMLESEKSVVELHDIESTTMGELIQYMYTGSIQVTTDNVQSLLQGASMLNLASLRNVCSHFLQLHIDASNCLGIYSLADMYSCVELESFAKRYIYQHFLDVVHHEEFSQLQEDSLIGLLQSDQLQVTAEEQVFEAFMLWLEADLPSRTPAACHIMKQIRLALLDRPYLENVVLRTHFVRNCPKCQNLVADAIRTKADNNALALVSTRSQPQGIFVVGGRNSLDCQLKSMERYDFLHDQWVSMTTMNVARTAVGAATINGIIYAVGGECAVADSQEVTMYLRCVEAYDPTRRQWHSCADMRIARSFVAVCAAGDCLYAIGGEDRTTSFNVVEKYCPQNDCWTFTPSMHRKRAGAGVAVCDGKIYVAGGYDKSFHTDRASVECFDPEPQEWAFVAEMEKARSGLALLALDHYLYAFGGRSRHNDQYCDMAERYNTWTLQWTSIAPMNTPRSWPSAAVMDNKVYVLGGFDGANRLPSVEVYDPETDTWLYIANMNVPRAGCAAAVL